MSTSQIVLAVAAAVLVFWAIGGYNRVVALRNAIAVAWTRVEEELARRRELALQLIQAVRSEMEGEADVLDSVIAASAQVTSAAHAVRPRAGSARAVASFAMAQAVFDAVAGRLFASIEGSEALRTRADVVAALNGWREAESRIGFARQAFNEAVQRYNAAARLFPTRILSWVFGFTAAGVW
jgi:LemA protein